MGTLESHVESFIKSELRTLRARQSRLHWLTACVSSEGGGQSVEIRRGTVPANPTLSKVLAILQDQEIQALQRRVDLLMAALNGLEPTQLRVVTILYIGPKIYTHTGAVHHLGISERHIRRLRDEALRQIAVAMGLTLT